MVDDPMSAGPAPVRRFYDGFLAHDARAILAELHPAFVGEVSAGMPLGLGGQHEGAEATLREVWAPVFRAYDVRVEVEELVASGDRVVALGAYRGTDRASGTPFEAAFAHVLTLHGDQITSLRQITDTRSWPDPG